MGMSHDLIYSGDIAVPRSLGVVVAILSSSLPNFQLALTLTASSSPKKIPACCPTGQGTRTAGILLSNSSAYLP